MKIAPPAQIIAHIERRAHGEAGARSELMLRYAAAYACTLIAVAAAQLYVPTPFALLLAAITIIGLPVSLYLRWSKLRLFGRQVPRFIINSTVVIVTGFACLYLLLLTQADLFTRGIYQTILVSHSATDSMAILMSMFLIFAATRSLAIINDKDAVLSAVPSFSVLLLLIVVHRGPAVVGYFLLWAIMAAILFTLDHRQESRQGISATIPSIEPGADIRLSARGLATVMSFSLVCAIGISYWLSSRNPEDRGVVESWILGMAGRMTQLALNIPEVSVNSGPERQIDFTSGPSLPTRTELWAVRAITYDWKAIQPEYWRMFTLSQYNGSTWSQTPGSGTPISFEELNDDQWPPLLTPGGRFQPTNPPAASPNNRDRTPSPNNRSDSRGNEQNSSNLRFGLGSGANQAPRAQGDRRASIAPNGFARRRRFGYDISNRHPQGQSMLRSFGTDTQWVMQIIEPRTSNVGFVPLMPAVRAVRVPRDGGQRPADSIRVRQNSAIDPGVLEAGQRLWVLSSVASSNQYGLAKKGGGPPTRKSELPESAIKLSSNLRAENLQLPEKLRARDSRVRLLAEEVLREAEPDESDYQRARRLALMLQQRAIYTLRPPAIPEKIDATEYFLFQSRRGYCTYFAGALTVLCRSAGIPARVVSGFVNPEWMENGEIGILREANAHAWTEVWVDGWGWASVDATPPDNRGDNAPDWWENWADLIGAVLDSSHQWLSANRVAVIWGALILLPLLLFASIRHGVADPLLARLQTVMPDRIHINQNQARRVIIKSYERAAKKLARRFRRRTHWETPSEWLAAAEATLQLESPQPLRELTRLYQQAKYSPREIRGEDGAAAVLEMRRISWRTKK